MIIDSYKWVINCFVWMRRLLRAMSKKGAQLIASGIYTKHLLDKLKSGKRGSV
jgi:hypothetical protein